MDKRSRNRKMIQVLGALIFNGNFKGFMEGRIYQGAGKAFCVPVLNCYSCPGALGACPIGSLQAVLGSPMKQFSFYVIGLLGLFGIVMGRWFCGFLCPFGLIQELLHKIPIKKIKVPKAIHRKLIYVKYFILALPVILLPMYLTDQFGVGSPHFCKYICPAGIIEGGFPLLIKNESLRNLLGTLFYSKLTIAILVIIFSVLIFRVFCRYLCPLGAFYGICHRVSFYRMDVTDACIKCNKCVEICPMDVEVYKEPNSAECIRCQKCVSVCPTNALKMGFKRKESEELEGRECYEKD